MNFNELSEGDRFVNSKKLECFYEIKDGKVMDCYYVNGKLIIEELSDIYIEHFKTLDSWVKLV
jgi:hypothetical protein